MNFYVRLTRPPDEGAKDQHTKGCVKGKTLKTLAFEVDTFHKHFFKYNLHLIPSQRCCHIVWFYTGAQSNNTNTAGKL